MSNFYERLMEFRDNYRKNNSHVSYVRVFPIFLQLMNHAFANESIPDVLPQVFTIKDIVVHEVELKNLLKQMGIDAEVKTLCSNYSTGFNFEIIQK